MNFLSHSLQPNLFSPVKPKMQAFLTASAANWNNDIHNYTRQCSKYSKTSLSRHCYVGINMMRVAAAQAAIMFLTAFTSRCHQPVSIKKCRGTDTGRTHELLSCCCNKVVHISSSNVTTTEITKDDAVCSYHHSNTTTAILIVSLAVFLNPVSWKRYVTIKTAHFSLSVVTCYNW